jgi:hypothetical protein
MLRVALGRARPETEYSGRISGLEFSSNPGGGAGAQASADRTRSHSTGGGVRTNTSLTISQSQMEHEVDIEVGDGVSDKDSVPGKENHDGAFPA